MHKQLLFFCLGSISTLAIFNSQGISLLNILSLSSFLLFVYLLHSEQPSEQPSEQSSELYKFRMLSLMDLLVLTSAIIFEYLFLSNTILRFINFKIVNYLGGGLMVLSSVYFLLSLYFSQHVSGIVEKKTVYAFVRHPLYSSFSLFVMSSCVYAKCFFSLGFYVFKLQNTFIERVREEERLIMKDCPQYLEYKREVMSGLVIY